MQARHNQSITHRAEAMNNKHTTHSFMSSGSKLSVSSVVGMLLLSACSMMPAYQAPALPVPANYNGGTAAVAGQVLAADLHWREVYKDDKLQQLIAAALNNNRDMRVAVLNIEKARAQYRVQGASLFPTINASGNESRQRISGDLSSTGQPYISNSYSTSVGFSSFELDLFGRVRSLKQQAAQAFLATEANQHSTKISLIAEVASAYYTLAADQALLALAQQTFNTQENTLKLTQRKLEIGVENQLTVSQQQTAVEEARADVANYTAQLAMDKNALALLVGGEVSSTLLPPLITAFPKIDVGLPTGLPSDVLTRRPDIISAEHSLLAANANIGAARAAFFPKIALTATAGSSSGDLARLFMGGTGVWSFVPSITLPIFDMGTNRANLKIANVERDISIATYEKTIQTAFKEVSDALAQATGLREQVKAYEVRQAAAQQSLQLSQARFNYGVDAYLTVLDAQRTLYSTQKTLISMQLAQLNNYASLYKVLGGGWQ